MELILRGDKGSALTHDEMDNNLKYLSLFSILSSDFGANGSKTIIEEIGKPPITLPYTSTRFFGLNEDNTADVSIFTIPNSKNMSFSYSLNVGGYLQVDIVSLVGTEFLLEKNISSGDSFVTADTGKNYFLSLIGYAYETGAQLTVSLTVTEIVP